MAKKAANESKESQSSSASNLKMVLRKRPTRHSVVAAVGIEKEGKSISAKRVTTKLKKKHGKLDSKMPKKPPTAFFYFLEDFRKGFQEQNPDIKSMRAIGKACGEKWKTMTYEEKVKYYDIATEKRAEFDRAMADYIKRKENGKVENSEEDSEFDEYERTQRWCARGEFAQEAKLEGKKMVTNVYENHSNFSNTCIILNVTTTNGIWPSKNPLFEPIPLLIVQLAFIITITRSLYFILRPLRQPRLVTDILGGLLLGPSFFGRKAYFSKLFPVRSVTTLETVAYMALDLYIFLIGLEMDVNSIKSSAKRELNIAAAGALIPMVRPGLEWLIRRTSKGNNNAYSDSYLCFFLIGVVICSFVTEVTGTFSIVGAFVFGIIMPDRDLGALLFERFADFVSGIMLPLFFAMCGIRTNVHKVHNWFLAGFVIILTCFCKILGTLLVSHSYHMPLQDRLALGVLMNTKGILAVVVLNLGWDKKVLHDQEYAVMVIAIVIMTGGVAPIISTMYRSSTRIIKYKGRSIQRAKQGAELRILACVHGVGNVLGTINLLELSNATKESPLCIFALHLVELRGSASAVLIVHTSSKNSAYKRVGSSPSDRIVNIFEAFENRSTGISVHPLTAMSPFITMHEDVCNLAEDKHIAFMILPFHNQAGNSNGDTTGSSPFREVNKNILANAPCSVGIFVDKGQGKSDNGRMQHVVMVFIGGPDDREALALAWRMSANPSVQLTVLRLHSRYNNNVTEEDIRYSKCIDGRQSQVDAEFVNEFRLQTAGEHNVNYYEKVVNNREETTGALREMELQKVGLYIVGREVMASAATADLLGWSECPEIGAIGDLLVYSDFIRASVLVVQHYPGDDGEVGAVSMRRSNHGLLFVDD
ncbi:hypothetical protein WN944_012504 [Citrus x changshan-huyou]|uniref:HMG box domain-containing protein n=1 Tax=Citrus x changshan-huyou TaxID=2935761 RepID=A0AAP0MVB0_9ROSI